MFEKRMNSFKKNMAILVCVAFISVVIPEVTHAATQPSSTEFPFSKKFFSLFSPVFSLSGLNFPLGVYDLATLYILSSNHGKPPPKPVNKTGKKNSSNNSIFKSNDNSTSKKPPKNKN